MRAAINAIVLLLFSFASLAQKDWGDTVYYNINMEKVKKKYARTYRIPVVQEGERFRVTYFHATGDSLSTGCYIPVEVKGQKSIEEKEAIKEGYFVYYSSGRKSRDGEYVNNREVGEWKVYFPDGKLSETEYYYDQHPPYVYLTKYTPNGKKYFEGGNVELRIENFPLFIRSGSIIFYYYDTDIVAKAVDYHNGFLTGSYKCYDSATTHKTIEGNFLEGKKDGKWQYFNVNTQKVVNEVQYKNGVLDGIVKEYDSLGNLIASGNHWKGLKEGLWKIFSSTGKTLVDIDFNVHSNKGDLTAYDTLTGKVKVKGQLVKEERSGTWLRYHSGTDKVQMKESYKHNMLDGEILEYDIEGVLLAKQVYDEGIRESMTINHDHTEKTWLELSYAADTLVKLRSYYLSGKVKREEYWDRKNQMVKNCFDEFGEKHPCKDIRSAPKFPGDAMTYIGNNLKYPEEAKDMRLEGKVLVGFTVNEDGSLSDIHVQKGFDQRCDEEAVRLVSSMPLWKPAEIDGKPFKMQQTLPIVFWLPEEKPDIE